MFQTKRRPRVQLHVRSAEPAPLGRTGQPVPVPLADRAVQILAVVSGLFVPYQPHGAQAVRDPVPLRSRVRAGHRVAVNRLQAHVSVTRRRNFTKCLIITQLRDYRLRVTTSPRKLGVFRFLNLK